MQRILHFIAWFSLLFSTLSYSLTGPFKTNNGQIIDGNQNPVTFQGVNWFGFNTGNHVLHGLWAQDFDTMLNQIVSLGFNAVRLPFQFDFIFNPGIMPTSINTACNGGPNTCNMDVPQDSALNTFKWVVGQFTAKGIFVLLDDHYEDDTFVNNQAAWIEGWKKVAQLFQNNPLVGYDLWNEPDSHSITWEDSGNGKPAWGNAILNAAAAIYTIDTKKLIFVEGTAQGQLKANWGNGFATDAQTIQSNISNPKNFFTQLDYQTFLNQIVISPHLYGPDGTNNQGPDLSDSNVAFPAWSRTFGYLLNNFMNVNGTNISGFCEDCGACHIYPIAVGEFGGKFDLQDPYYAKDYATQLNIANFLKQLGTGQASSPSWFYWDWNPNSGNTGGILKDDWRTIDCNKVNYLKQYLFLKPQPTICP